MRMLTCAVLTGVLLMAVPAFAQNDQGGLGGIIRNLDNQMNNRGANPNYNQPNRYNQQYDQGNSGSSQPEYGTPYGSQNRMVFRNQSDMQREENRLWNMQSQINSAQQKLSNEWNEFSQARRNFERTQGQQGYQD